LFDAFGKGDASAVQMLLENGADPNARGKYNWPALHCAVSETGSVRLLLKNGADVNAQNEIGYTALHCAAKENVEASTKVLLAYGANPNITDKWGKTPLYYAALNGYADIAQVLLNKDADPNIAAKDKQGNLPIILAARNGYGEIVQALLAKGANPNARNLCDETALHWAAYNSFPDIVQMLLAVKGTDVNALNGGGGTPLVSAVACDRLDCVKILLNSGADLNIRYGLDKSKTALDMAIANCQPETIEILRQRGAKTGKEISKPLGYGELTPAESKAEECRKQEKLFQRREEYFQKYGEPMDPEFESDYWTFRW
jgi:ankyrin repeat protein